MGKRFVTEVVRRLGDKMIKEAEKGDAALLSPLLGLHEIEKPECLRKHDSEKVVK